MSDKPPWLEELSIEAARIEEDAEVTFKGHFNAAARWGCTHYWLGVPAFLLAIVAGGTAIQGCPWVTTISAFLSAILSATATFLNPQDKAVLHKRAGDQFLALRNQARIFKNIEVASSDPTEAKTHLLALSGRRTELNESSPIVPGYAYQKAKQGLNEGQNDYKADKEGRQ